MGLAGFEGLWKGLGMSPSEGQELGCGVGGGSAWGHWYRREG